MSKRTIANLVTFLLVAVLFFGWAVTSLVKVDSLNRPYRIKGEFASAIGVLGGAEVDYLGVTYGTVSHVQRVPGGVEITMKIDHGKQIPKGATAHLFRKSALGEQYVELEPPAGYTGHGGPYYAKGAVIGRDQTTVPLEFSELLRSASRLVSAIPPEDVGTLVHEAALGLEGRVDSLHQLADAGDRISQMLVSRTDALDRLATNNTRLTHVVTEHRDSLGASLSDLRAVADSLKNARGDTSILLDRGAVLLSETADLVAKHKADLDCDLKTLEIVTDVTNTPARLDELSYMLDQAEPAFNELVDASEIRQGPVGRPGRWLRVGLMTNPQNPPPEFVPAKLLPVPKAVPACSSPLRPAGIDYLPAASTGPAVPVPSLPATGGAGLVVAALALVGGALIVRSCSSAGTRQS